MSWVWDAPDGVYKDHTLSSKIREAALAKAVFMRFVSPERGYGKGKGQSVTIQRVLQLPLANRVGETDRLPEGRPAVETIQKAVSEWGFKTELTEFEESLGNFDLRNKFQRMLRNQMQMTMDKMVADAMTQASAGVIKARSTSATAVSYGTAGSFTGTATHNLEVAHLRDIKDYLHGTLKAPAYGNGNYIGILSTKAARGLKNDTEFKDWLSPTDAMPFVNGMLGTIDGITLIETNHFDALSNSVAAGVTGEAVFFGEDAGFLASVTDPELRVGTSEDLGRFRQIGWYGIIDAGIVWDTAANSRIVHWGPA
jgi:N4-gp56 family major capsid protein